MSLIGLVNLAEKLFNQTQGNPNEDSGGPNRPAKTTSHATHRDESDEFRPSHGNTANEAGLFQVTQQSVVTAAVSALLVQPGGTTAAAAAPSPAVSPTTATPATPVSNAATSGNAVITVPAVTTNTQTTDDAQLLTQLQSLNDALAALGLGDTEIAAIDRVAQLIKDFSPAAFTSLISQLNALARNTAQPTAAAGNATDANAAGAGQSGGFSIQELSIKFAGVNETVQKGRNTLQISAFQLQVSEVNLTLNNAATGQTAQIQAPQAAASTTNSAAPITKAATA